MNVIQLLPLGDVGDGALERLAQGLSAEFPASCEILRAPFDALPALHTGRQQYHSTQILARMQAVVGPAAWRLLGVTPFDLYIPILTFVFGEAQLSGGCAVVSTYRLRQEFYGLPPDLELMRERLLKEAVHELGHTFSLSHCEDYRCAMAPSHAVEWIDLKTSNLCPACRALAGTNPAVATRR